jgi:DNA topoisomerase-3
VKKRSKFVAATSGKCAPNSSAPPAYEGRWLDTKFKKDENDPEKRRAPVEQGCGRLIALAVRGKQGNVTEESKPTTSMAPGLFDLTSLQREANSRFGFSAKNTLGLAQALYEKHKVLTYPRTDSRHLPEDYLDTVKQTLETVKENNNYHQFAKQILDKGWVKPNKRIFDNTKISDHFAIIPTRSHRRTCPSRNRNCTTW